MHIYITIPLLGVHSLSTQFPVLSIPMLLFVELRTAVVAPSKIHTILKKMKCSFINEPVRRLSKCHVSRVNFYPTLRTIPYYYKYTRFPSGKCLREWRKNETQASNI